MPTSDPATTNDNNNNGGDNYTPGTVPNPLDPSQVSQAAGEIGSSISSTLTSPITGWFNQAEADVFNIINQLGNTFFYGSMVCVGAVIVFWGLVLLFKETSAGKAVGSIGSLFATAAVPEAKAAKVATGAKAASTAKAAPKAAPKAAASKPASETTFKDNPARSRAKLAQDRRDYKAKGAPGEDRGEPPQ